MEKFYAVSGERNTHLKLVMAVREVK